MQHISTIHRIPEFYTKMESDSHFYNPASLASQATDSHRMRLKKPVQMDCELCLRAA